MKRSGIAWIPAIPDDWSVRKGKYLFNCVQKPVRPDDGIITCFRDGEVTLRSKRRDDGFTIATKEFGYQGIDVGDLVVHGMDGFAGSIGISDSRGKASPVLNNLSTTHDKRFFMYFLRTMAYQGIFLALSTGIRVRTCDTNWGKLKELKFAFPKIKEQRKISTFLDKKIEEIDSLIVVEEAQIVKLEEYKRAVINEAVTKGLDKKASMKDSGVAWIGKIPEKWTLCRFKNVATIANGKEIETEGGEIPVYGSGGVFKYTDKPLFTGRSLLLGRKGTIDKPMLVSGPFWTVDTMFYTSEIRNIDEKYLYYCAMGLINFDFYKSGSVLPSMTQTELNNIVLTYPTFDEQKQIVAFLDKKCAEIEVLITVKQKKIDSLVEYKKSIIYEYVTGKREVIA